MRLSIQYSGRLKAPHFLPALIQDVQEFATAHGWKYEILNTRFPTPHFAEKEDVSTLYGIYFIPTHCEAVSIAFLSNGRLVNPVSAIMYDKELEEPGFFHEGIYIHQTKTQSAGPEIHKILIGYFRYLNQKYLHEFEMHDDSLFWEMNDEMVLLDMFQEYEERRLEEKKNKIR